MRTLIVAEKPSAAKDIAQALLGKTTLKDGYIDGGQILVTWAIGHLVQLAAPEMYDEKYKKWKMEHLPIIPRTFRLVAYPKTKKQLRIIGDLAKKCDLIVNAADAGREGELIFGYICQLLKIDKPVKRLWTSSLTPTAIREAFQNAKDGAAYHNLLAAAKARSEADWLIGMNGSRAFTIKHGELFSVGRVQTPVLAMLKKRQEIIEQFTPEPYYLVEAWFRQGDQSYRGVWQGERITSKEKAAAIADRVQGKPAAIVSYDEKTARELPPKLYDLTTLQREANRRYGFSAQKTLDLAQKLYERYKAITYPRTSSAYVEETNIPFMHNVCDQLGSSRYGELARGADKSLVHSKNRNVCRPEKVGDHHAIMPTEQIPQSLTGDIEKIYSMIVKRFLAHFYPPAHYRHHTLLTEVEQETFKTHVKVALQLGWKTIYGEEKQGKGKQNDSEEDAPQLAPSFAIDPNGAVRCEQAQVKDKMTTPPKWYDEDTLLKDMETAGKFVEDEEMREAMKDCGIGTPATRSAIIERLREVGYIERKGKKLVVTTKGRSLIDMVEDAGIGVLSSPELTGQWEQRLHQISIGSASAEPFMGQVKTFASVLVQKVQAQQAAPSQTSQSDLDCPTRCGGKIVKSGKGYHCTNRDCAFLLKTFAFGRPLSEKEIRDLLEKGRTGLLRFKSRQGKSYKAKLELNRDTGELSLTFPGERRSGPPTDRKPRSTAADGMRKAAKTKASVERKANPQAESDRTQREVSATADKTKRNGIGICPRCRRGEMVEGQTMISCTGYPKCRFYIPKQIREKDLSMEQLRQLLREGKTGWIDGFVDKDGTSFSATLILADGLVRWGERRT
ncbi:DNA topoisomerase 3 [Brevibacillus humidisoli]|uniref:DNA topoisomerase 3 n=1 Tax=Brevibacillus humidisoli TaxID=2895522 RepID=UPI0030B9DC8C